VRDLDPAQAAQRQRGDVLGQLAANGEVAPPRVERDANLTLLVTHGAHRHEKGDPGLLRRAGAYRPDGGEGLGAGGTPTRR
jgi:hypothetical protein